MPEELHISYVTNGALPDGRLRMEKYRWACLEKFKRIITINFIWRYLPSTGSSDQRGTYGFTQSVDPSYKASVWLTRRVRLISRRANRGNSRHLAGWYSDHRFARRFATYKRAHLLSVIWMFERDRRITRTVRFSLLRESSPGGSGRSGFDQGSWRSPKYPQFLGKILFLPNYDMDLARHMVQEWTCGWIPRPVRAQEASGTSGRRLPWMSHALQRAGRLVGWRLSEGCRLGFADGKNVRESRIPKRVGCRVDL